MKMRKQRLILDQVDRKLEPFKVLDHVEPPAEGWIHAIRTALNMTLEQLGRRAAKSAQNVKALEKNEKYGTITVQSLFELGKAMDMHFVYGFVPKDGSLKQMVEKRAMVLAQEIVNRSAQTMSLEDQSTTKDDLMNAFNEKKNELMTEIPKHLWR